MIYNTGAEESVLGAMLIKPDAIEEVKGVLRGHDFYIVRNGWIYSVMVALLEAGESVDFITIGDKLERMGKLDEAGGEAYLVRLLDVVPTSMHVMSYAKIVRDCSIRRAASQAAGIIAEAAANEEANLHDALMTARATIDAELYRAASGDLTFFSADFILTHQWPEIVWAIPELLPTGLTILAGRPKLGKSYLALQIAQAVAAGGVALGQRVQAGPVLYLALEDPGRRLKERMIQQHWDMGLPADFMILGQFEDQVGYLQNGGGERLAARIADARYRLVVIDTLSKAMAGDQLDMEAMNLAFAPVQRMSHDLNCATLIVDHHRKPGMVGNLVDDVMGSTAKAASADTVWGLYRERGKAGAKLSVTGRDIEERNLALTMDWGVTYCWQVEGDADEIAATERFDEILQVLGTGAMQCNDVANAVGQDRSNTHKRLQVLEAKGQVRRIRDGRRVLYQRVGLDSL
jgi:hypothetical protein